MFKTPRSILVAVLSAIAVLLLAVVLPYHPPGALGGASLFGLLAVGSMLTSDDTVKYLIAIGLLDSAGGFKYAAVRAKTADYTIVTGTDPSFTLFTNRGASGAVIFTLPAPAASIAGTIYDFLGIADQNLSVKTATADTLIALNDVAADSVAASTSSQKIGASLRAVCDGTSWIVFGNAVGVTATVAT